MSARRLYLLSPANSGGRRARQLLGSSRTELAARLDTPGGAAIGDIFAYMSGLYFRGKLAYARAFAASPDDALVITPSRGLLPVDHAVTRAVLEEFAATAIAADDLRYRVPLARDLLELGARPDVDVVLLGSIASPKYVPLLLEFLGDRLWFPAAFVGRGDMSRGGLLLRAAAAGQPLEYARIAGAVLRGTRPPRLEPLPRQPAMSKVAY